MKGPIITHPFHWRWLIFSYLGFILLLLGNVLPWPCIAGGRDCTALQTYHLDNSTIGVWLIIGILLLPLIVNLNTPLKYLFWCSFWIFIYLLMVARLVSVSPDMNFQLPVVLVNQYLAGPSMLVMPLCLIFSWLAIRPFGLQGKLKVVEIIGSIIILLLTSYFAISYLTSLTQFQIQAEASHFEYKVIFGLAPLFIVAGCLTLLGRNFVYIRRWEITRAPMDTPVIESADELPGQQPTSTKFGFWTAILIAGLSVFNNLVFPIIIGYGPWQYSHDIALTRLFDGLSQALSLLSALSFIGLIVLIGFILSPQKIIPKLGLFFAIINAIDIALHFNIPMYLKIVERVHSLIPTSMQVSALSRLRLLSMSLALLCTLPFFATKQISVSIRRLIVIYALLNISSIISVLLRMNYYYYAISSLISTVIIFPVIALLMARYFRRIESERN